MGKYQDFGTALDKAYRNLLNFFKDDVDNRLNEQKTRVDTIVASVGNSNTEIVDARGTFPVVRDRLNAVDSSLAAIATQPLNYSGRGTGQNIPISTAFPSVTLASVQGLNPAATLSDSADWYVLQDLINRADINNYKRINFPAGTFILSKTLDFTQKLSNCLISSKGCTLKPSSSFTGQMVILDHGADYSKSRNLQFDGLEIDGLYRTSVGIDINDAHEWFLNNIIIRNCFVGLQLADTYYGEMSGHSVIQNCLKGIRTDKGSQNEVNTIDLSNTKINFAVDKRTFIPQNAGETDVAYDNRVISIGVEITTITQTVKFSGLTLEAMDYGYYGATMNINATSLFHIHNNYFEVIKKEAIRLVSLGGYAHIFNVSISNCRFAGMPTVIIGQGKFEIYNNEDFNLTILEYQSYVTTLYTDLATKYITYNKTIGNIFIKHDYIPTAVNANKYKDYGDNNTSPHWKSMLPTIQDELSIEHISILKPTQRVMNSQIFSLNTKPLSFIGKHVGPVIQGFNNKYYMMETKDGSGLLLTEVLNLNRLEPPLGSKTAKELYLMTGVADGTSYFCLDIDNTVTYKASTGKWVINFNLSNEKIAIGTGVDFATAGPQAGAWGSPKVWNVQVDYGYNSQDNFWGGYDWYGKTNTQRAIGTLAQRPANPTLDGFIYYASDTATYYQWSVTGGSWSTYTPLF